MWPSRSFLMVVTTSVVHGSTAAVNCRSDEQRQPTSPPGSDIVLTVANSGAVGNLCNEIHASGKRGLDNNGKTVQGMFLYARESTSSGYLIDEIDCQQSFLSILTTCVENGAYWGGNITSKGWFYEMWNIYWPADPFSIKSSSTGFVTSITSAGSQSSGLASPGNASNPNQIVLPQTDSAGNVVLVAWTPSTVPGYASLHTTTTVTTTAEWHGAPFLVPLVIGIGGLAYVFAGVEGAGAVGALTPVITPPTIPPEPNEPDEPDDPDPEPASKMSLPSQTPPQSTTSSSTTSSSPSSSSTSVFHRQAFVDTWPDLAALQAAFIIPHDLESPSPTTTTSDSVLEVSVKTFINPEAGITHTAVLRSGIGKVPAELYSAARLMGKGEQYPVRPGPGDCVLAYSDAM